MADTETAGTPGQDGGDAAAKAATAGTPAPDDRNAGDDANLRSRLEALEREKQQWLPEKTNYEEAKRRLAELEAHQGQAQSPPTGYDPNAYQQQEAMRVWQELQETNPAAAQAVAATAQMAQREIQQVRAELRWYREMEAVPAAERAAVEARAKALGVSPEWAHARIKAEALDSSMANLVEQKRKLQEEQERLKRGTVQTDAAPAPPKPPDSTEITATEYGKLARAAATGDVAARRRMRDYDEGRLKVRDG